MADYAAFITCRLFSRTLQLRLSSLQELRGEFEQWHQSKDKTQWLCVIQLFHWRPILFCSTPSSSFWTHVPEQNAITRTSLWLNDISSTHSSWRLQYATKESSKFRGREVRLFTQKATLIECSLLMRRTKNALTGSLDSAQMCFAEYLRGLDWINSPAALQVHTVGIPGSWHSSKKD